MTRAIVYPSDMCSMGARFINAELGGLMVYPDRKYRPRRGDVIINWGNSSAPKWAPAAAALGVRVLNDWKNIQVSVSKLDSLKVMQAAGVPVIPFTTNIEEAQGWIRESYAVICRKLLRASAGDGIVVAKTMEELVKCPLFTRFVRKTNEYRAHVFNGKVTTVLQKKRKHDAEVDPFIRSHRRGWVFCQENINPPEAVGQAALDAVKALGLDFGGVDVLYSLRHEKPYVLEVNTAPGLEGTRKDIYSKVFKEHLNLR